MERIFSNVCMTRQLMIGNKAQIQLARFIASTQQIVGRERQERASHHDWSGDA